MSHALQPAAERFHALDAVRAGALLLGVAVHASLSFFPTQIWPIGDSHRSTEILVGFLTSHIFRMSLFFVIAGFFAHMLLHKRGVKGFIKDRLKRIGLPLVVFWPFLFAAFMGVIIWSAVKASGGEMPEPPAGSLTWRTVPLLHTWFLYVLLLFYVGALALFGLSRLIDSKGHIGKALDGAVRVLAKTHLLPFVLGAPLAAVFFFHESWVAWAGVHTPDMGLAPNIPAMVAFGTAFAFGWLLHRQPQLLSIWRRWWPLYLAAAVALTIVCVRIVLTGAPLGNASSQTAAGADLLTAAVNPLAIWAWCFALIGAAMRFLSGENKVVRYLADSSYWLYLIHLPIVMAGQVIVSQWDISAYVKFPLIVAGSVALMLASYQLLVRGTFLGGWLNGRRYGKRAEARLIARATVAPAE